MKLPKPALGAALGVAALVLVACGGGSNNPLGQSSSGSPSGGASGAVVVGSGNFTESEVLAELYSQAMKAKGVNASTKLNIGAREVYIKALQDGSITAVPEYTGNLLLNFDKSATARTPREVEKAIPGVLPQGLKVLKSSPATDQDVYVVTKDFAQKNGITSLADLSKVAPTSTLGGRSELATRAYGPMGLEKEYGVKFKAFKPYDTVPVKVSDLNAGKIQVAAFFTTDSAIAQNGYVELKDPKSLILPQNVIPLIRSEVASNSTAAGAVEAVQAALTTDDLIALDKAVDSEHQDPNQVAAQWLKTKGLV
jgi:osmoprotectant transport system substrate-binding protein